jgi:archaellum component FlaC
MNLPHLVLMACAALLLSACMGPKTPQDVAEAFWQAVIDDDIRRVVRYSTLTDAQAYDGFARDWTGYRPAWGRVVIEGDRASIVSEFSKAGGTAQDRREFVTYLVRQDDRWRVDYARTADSVRGDVIANLLGRLSELGSEISEQWAASTRELDAEVARMIEEIEALADSLGARASEGIDKYADVLRQHLEELQESINRALREKDDLSDRDRRLLQEVAADLDQTGEGLADPSVESIADGGRAAVEAQARLDTTDDDVTGEYKRRWHEWGERFEAQMRRLLNELAASDAP